MFENRVMKLFGSMYKVTEDWCGMYNVELKNLHASLNIIPLIKKKIRWARHMTRIGHRRGAYKILVGKLNG